MMTAQKNLGPRDLPKVHVALYCGGAPKHVVEVPRGPCDGAYSAMVVHRGAQWRLQEVVVPAPLASPSSGWCGVHLEALLRADGPHLPATQSHGQRCSPLA